MPSLHGWKQNYVGAIEEFATIMRVTDVEQRVLLARHVFPLFLCIAC